MTACILRATLKGGLQSYDAHPKSNAIASARRIHHLLSNKIWRASLQILKFFAATFEPISKYPNLGDETRFSWFPLTIMCWITLVGHGTAWKLGTRLKRWFGSGARMLTILGNEPCYMSDQLLIGLIWHAASHDYRTSVAAFPRRNASSRFNRDSKASVKLPT